MADDQTGYPGTDVVIKKLGDKQATKDLKTLCKSKHSVVIGLTPPPTADSPATPYETSIAVLFTASDTSGAGLVGEAYTKLLFDPLEYEKTVAQGLDIVWDRDNQTVGDYTEAVAYTGTYIVTAPVRAVAAAGNALVKGVASLFGAEGFSGFSGFSERKADTWGTDLHYEDASAHKIRIQIFNTPPNGTRRQVYDSELAGSSESVSVGDREFVKPAVAYFAIDAPGKWEVFIDSIGSGTCANPKLKFSKSFTVEPPPETQPESLGSVDTDGDGVAETLVSTQGSRGTATSVPTVGLETIIGGTLLTGVFLYALLAPRRE